PLGAYMEEFEKSGDEGAAAGRAFLEMLEVVPIVGGSIRYGSTPYGAVASTIYDATKVIGGKAPTRKALETTGKLIGLPGTSQINKFNRWLQNQP
ncbi:MAG: hypothetical protein ACYS21_07130, partial [Planctomycetota bacterium]